MFLGFDTSNYTTSVAIFDGENIIQQKQLLSVKKGDRGLRQSDAVFQHTVNLPCLLDKLPHKDIKAVGVSSRPRNIDGSYMPCFLVGKNSAKVASYSLDVPCFETSHQIGHILAALFSSDKLNLIKEKFIAFHVSGGTTEALLVEPDSQNVLKATLIAESTDLKAGQLIDRTGVLLDISFPCGAELEKLALNKTKDFNIRPSMNGVNCSLSGVENKVIKMINDNESKENVAYYALSFVAKTIEKMTESLLKLYPSLPVLYAGGVMSDEIIQNALKEKFDNIYFAKPEFSCDNASGIAIYAALKFGELL